MIEIKELSFEYRNGQKALGGIDLNIKLGEFILLSGPSGSGKSTLARSLNALVPNFYSGNLSGSVKVFGKEATDCSVKDMSSFVGMLFQDPEAMLLADTVEEEIRLTASSIAYARQIMGRLGLQALRKRSIHELSGGEKQKVALASVLARKPKILILDEPLSELDHESADALLNLLEELKEEGIIIILIEQRSERVYLRADREIILRKGKIAYDGKANRGGALGMAPKTTVGDALVRISHLSFSYEKTQVFSDFSEEFREGEVVVLTGKNGSGKSSLLKLMMGLLKPDDGEINLGGLINPKVGDLAGNVGYVFQNPDKHLFSETVGEEVSFILDNTKQKGDIKGILRRFGILRYKDRYPRYLSGGEKQRVALSSILVAKPKVLLLDEPTRGMDHRLKEELAEYLKDYVAKGNLVIMATHDDFMQSIGTRRLNL